MRLAVDIVKHYLDRNPQTDENEQYQTGMRDAMTVLECIIEEGADAVCKQYPVLWGKKHE
jgi:hypothetical protein